MDLAAEFMSAVINAFETNKRLADRAVAQLPDDKVHAALDVNTNSIAIIMKHVAGNLLSRWTDFLVTDGEKPWRDRESEFDARRVGHDELRRKWEDGWSVLFAALGELSDADLGKRVTIRGESLSVHAALHRSLAHTAHHVGQIVLLGKMLKGGDWRTLSTPRQRRT